MPKNTNTQNIQALSGPLSALAAQINSNTRFGSCDPRSTIAEIRSLESQIEPLRKRSDSEKWTMRSPDSGKLTQLFYEQQKAVEELFNRLIKGGGILHQTKAHPEALPFLKWAVTRPNLSFDELQVLTSFFQ